MKCLAAALVLACSCSSPPRQPSESSPTSKPIRSAAKQCDTARRDLPALHKLCDDGYLRACERGARTLANDCDLEEATRLADKALAELGHLAAGPTPPRAEQEASRALHAAGIALRDAGKLKEAVGKLEAAQARWPHPLILVDLAETHAKAKRNRLARVIYARAAALAEAQSGKKLVPRPRHRTEGRYNDLAIHPTRKLLALASGSRIFLWDAERNRITRTLRGHQASVGAVAFRDASTLISASIDGQVRVWDMNRGDSRVALTHRFDKKTDDDDRGIALAPKGERAAFFGPDGLSVFNVQSGTAVLVRMEETDYVEFLPRGMLYSRGRSACENNDMPCDDQEGPATWIFDGKGRLVAALDEHFEALVFSPSGRRVAVQSETEGVLVYRFAGWRRLQTFKDATLGCFFSEGELVLGDNVHSVKTGKRLKADVPGGSCSPASRLWWQLAHVAIEDNHGSMEGSSSFTTTPFDGAEQKIFGYEISVYGVTDSLLFGPRGNYLAVARPDGVHLFDLRSWTSRRLDHKGADSLGFDANGDRLVVAGAKKISVWNVRTARSQWSANDFKKFSGAVAFSPGGATITTSQGSNLRFYDARTGIRTGETKIAGFGISQLRYSADGKRLFVRDVPNGGVVYDADYKMVNSWRESLGSFVATMSNSGEFLVASSQYQFVEIRRPGSKRRSRKTSKGWALGVAINEDDTVVASGDFENIVRVHPIGKLDSETVMRGAYDKPRNLAFRPKSNWLAAGNEGPIVTLFDYRAGRRLAHLVMHPGSPFALVAELGIAGPLSDSDASPVYFEAGDLELPGEVDWKTWIRPPSALFGADR